MKETKKIISLALALIITFALVPVFTMPVGATVVDYALYFVEKNGNWSLYKDSTGDTEYTDRDLWSVTKDGETVVLTLKDGFKVDAVSGNRIVIEGGEEPGGINGLYIPRGADVTLIIEGDVEIKGDDNGIFSESALTIKGDGKLTASTDSHGIGITVYDNDLTISGGTINATGGYGIAADDINITGGTVYAKGEVDGLYGIGIFANRSLEISGGTVNTEGDSLGIWTKGSIRITGGTVTAAGDESAFFKMPTRLPDSYTATWSTNKDGTGSSTGSSYTWGPETHRYVRIATEGSSDTDIPTPPPAPVPEISAVDDEPEPESEPEEMEIEPEPEPESEPDPIDIEEILTGADSWADTELTEAVESGLIIEAMHGNWTNPTNRLVAAEAIVNLIVVSTGKSVEHIAEEKGFDMTDSFDDTDSIYATFLKVAGISAGVGNNSYDPSGTFTRVQMVTMLGRIATNIFDMDLSGYPLGTDVFTDVPDWAGTNEAIGWAAEIGITQGVGGGRFDSNGVLQNQHTGVFAFRAFDKAFGN